MSFKDKQSGKAVWGTAVHRIHCEIVSKRIRSDFTGKVTFYERRHEVFSVRFETLAKFIEVMRDMWIRSLRVSTVQDTRLARWLEEYFEELSIQTDYDEILDVIRGTFVEVPTIEVAPEQSMTLEDITSFLSGSPDFKIMGITREIKGKLDDQEEMEKILANFTREYKPQRSESAISDVNYETSDGSKKVNNFVSYTNSPLHDDVLLEVTFTNPENITINNVTQKDTIPYDYQIVYAKSLGADAIKGESVKTDNGLQFQWQVPTLNPGQSTIIEYTLRQRMLRTIMIRDDNQLNIYQSYENINREGDDVWIDSKFKFWDKTPIIENAKILDQLPKHLKLITSTPDIVEPMGVITTGGLGTDILWSYTSVPANTQFNVEYELKSNTRMFKDQIHLIGRGNSHVADIVKVIKPLENAVGYGVIYSINATNDIPENIVIKDTLPAGYIYNLISVDHGDVVQEVSGESRNITWNPKSVPLNQDVSIFIKLLGDGKFNLENFSVGSTTPDTELDEQVEVANELKLERIIMPETYIYEVDKR